MRPLESNELVILVRFYYRYHNITSVKKKRVGSIVRVFHIVRRRPLFVAVCTTVGKSTLLLCWTEKDKKKKGNGLQGFGLSSLLGMA